MFDSNLEDSYKADENGFLRPAYDGHCIANIPWTVTDYFGMRGRKGLPKSMYNGGKEKVILFLFDGFGYTQWKRARKEPFINAFVENGTVSPITTVFPSTTSASLTTLSTGLTPQEHCVPEWTVFLREVGSLVYMLPFTALGSRGPDGLTESGFKSDIIFEGSPVYRRLQREGIKSFAFINETYATSAYSSAAMKGSQTVPFANIADLPVILRKKVESVKGPAYFYVYVSDVDTIEHDYGPFTEEHYSQISLLSYSMKTQFVDKIDRKTAKEIEVFATADHGQIQVDPKKTLYLNRFGWLKKSFMEWKGTAIEPSGGARDVFLHIKQEKLDYVISKLRRELRGKAVVKKTKDAVEEGLFGLNAPKDKFLERVGNVLILPLKNGTIWYEHIKGRKFEMRGHHGGLTPDEMLVPFASANLTDLKRS